MKHYSSKLTIERKKKRVLGCIARQFLNVSVYFWRRPHLMKHSSAYWSPRLTFTQLTEEGAGISRGTCLSPYVGYIRLQMNRFNSTLWKTSNNAFSRTAAIHIYTSYYSCLLSMIHSHCLCLSCLLFSVKCVQPDQCQQSSGIAATLISKGRAWIDDSWAPFFPISLWMTGKCEGKQRIQVNESVFCLCKESR